MVDISHVSRAGLKITASQRTMSGLIVGLTGQTLVWPVILTGHFWMLPACRRLLFPLLHAEKGRLCNAVANHVPASRWVPKILGTCCDGIG